MVLVNVASIPIAQLVVIVVILVAVVLIIDAMVSGFIETSLCL